MSGLQNATSPYWAPQTIYSTGHKSQKRYDGYGFTFKLPWNDVSTAGWYFGENPVPQRHELVFRSDPEWGAVEDTIPASGGVPKYNPYDKNLQFRRSKYVRKISS